MSSNPSLTDSINKDITNSFTSSPSVSPSTLALETSSSSKKSSSGSFIFFLFIIVVFGLLVFLFLYYYEGLKEKIISFLPSFLHRSTPTPTTTFEPITTPPVSTMSPTSIPTTNLHDQHDNDVTMTSGTKEPQIDRPTEPPFKEDDSYSSIQQNQTTGKSGWCFIGEDRGFRSCAKVGVNDKCMSGDIFPSHEICVNPTLRA